MVKILISIFVFSFTLFATNAKSTSPYRKRIIKSHGNSQKRSPNYILIRTTSYSVDSTITINTNDYSEIQYLDITIIHKAIIDSIFWSKDSLKVGDTITMKYIDHTWIGGYMRSPTPHYIIDADRSLSDPVDTSNRNNPQSKVTPRSKVKKPKEVTRKIRNRKKVRAFLSSKKNISKHSNTFRFKGKKHVSHYGLILKRNKPNHAFVKFEDGAYKPCAARRSFQPLIPEKKSSSKSTNQSNSK